MKITSLNHFWCYELLCKQKKQIIWRLGECPSCARTIQFTRNWKHIPVECKVYFPHELLQWPRKRPLHVLVCFFFLSELSVVQHSTSITMLIGCALFDFSTNSDKRVSPTNEKQKNISFQCFAFHLLVANNFMVARDMLYWFQLKLDSTV